VSIIIRTKEGAPSCYTLELDPPTGTRYERTYTVRRFAHRLAEHSAHPLETVTAYYTVRDMYPRPEIIDRDPLTAPDLPRYVLDRVRVEDERDSLRGRIRREDTIYTVRRSPMGRGPAHLLDLYHIESGDVYCISYPAAIAAGLSYRNRSHCVHMSGGGMDLGYAAVDALSWALFGESVLRHKWL
jgi:hypothetical protein